MRLGPKGWRVAAKAEREAETGGGIPERPSDPLPGHRIPASL